MAGRRWPVVKVRALIIDTEGDVTLVIDAGLEGAAVLTSHPMTHTESVSLTAEQFAAFVVSCGKEPLIVPLA